MDKTSAMAEDNDPSAIQLTEVASLEDGEDEVVYAECDLNGALKRQQRKTKRVPPPSNPEELRAYYIVLENSFLYLKYKHHNIAWLNGFKPGPFERLAKYLLGKKCLKLEAASDNDCHVAWSTILKYEYQIRKYAMELIKEKGLSLSDALEVAAGHEETRSLYFTANVTFAKKRKTGPGAGKGGAQYEDAWPKKIKKGAVGNKGTKDKGKGKNKGKKQKGKGRQHVKGGLNVMGQTPDQRMLCFKWNDGQDCDGSCNMVHACRVKDCYKADHPMIKHPGFDESKGFWFA